MKLKKREREKKKTKILKYMKIIKKNELSPFYAKMGTQKCSCSAATLSNHSSHITFLPNTLYLTFITLLTFFTFLLAKEMLQPIYSFI